MKLCEYCLKPMNEFHQGHICSDCKKWLQSKTKGKAGRKPRVYKTKKPKKSIAEVMNEIEAYNRENGTHLSYGQYMVLTNSEK